MREVTFRVRHNGEPECEVSARFPKVTLRSVSSMTGRRTERKRIVELAGDPDQIEAFLEEFARAEPVLEAEPLSPLGEPRVYAALTYDATKWDSISERLSDLGVHYRTGTTIAGGWERWTVYLEDPAELPTVKSALQEGGNDVDLVRNIELSEVTAPRQLDATRLLDELTPRQFETLATAVDEGYYRHQRETSIEELADKLGVGTSTTWEHLSRAEQKVMDGLADRLTAGSGRK